MEKANIYFSGLPLKRINAVCRFLKVFFISDITDLSCPPRVVVGQPEGSVTLGSKVQLTCHVAGNFRSAHWSHGGHVIGNNTIMDRKMDGDHQVYTINTREIKKNHLWVNLTVVNVDM